MIRVDNADDLIEVLKIKSPEEIKVKEIAQKCGAEVIEKPWSKVDAFLIGIGEKAYIHVNKVNKKVNKYSRERQRFSIAHEIGHWMLHSINGQLGGFYCNVNDGAPLTRNNLEQQADDFAADLLMPKKFFCQNINEQDPIFDSVFPLAKTYKTSLTAASIRFTRFSRIPMMVVYSSLNGRIWYYGNERVTDNVKPHEKLQPGNVAFDLLKSKNKTYSPKQAKMGAECWISGKQKENFSLLESSINITDKTVLSLISWEGN